MLHQRQKIAKMAYPKVMNSIWLTAPNKPKELLDTDIDNVIANKKFFGNEWTFVVWTNNKKLIPESVKKLQKNGIKIKELQEFQEDHPKTCKLIGDLVGVGKFGMASDLFRQFIIAEKGGVYADLNFKFLQPIDSYIEQYDFFAQDYRNSFFAAKAAHPITESTIVKIYQAMRDLSVNKQVTSTSHITYLPYILSIIEHANEKGNSDFYYHFYAENDLGYYDLIGVDNYAGIGRTWIHNGNDL